MEEKQEEGQHMAKKELSPHAPDRWIRELNRRYPSLWTDLRKGYQDPITILRPGSGGIDLLNSVPDWCIMPTLFPFLLMTSRYGMPFYLTHMDEMMTMASMYIWRCSKGVYRFAHEIYDALIRQPLTGNLPQECLYHMPEWAVYIETPGLSYERIPMEGFIAHLDYNLFSRGVDLQFAIFRKGIDAPKMIALPLGEGTLPDAMDRVDKVDDMFAGDLKKTRYVGSRDEYRQTFSSMLQLLLYLCSEEPDMPEIEHPQKHRRFSGGVRTPEAPRVWNVGVRVSAAIKRYNGKTAVVNQESGTVLGCHASPRPHVRSAHWHTYWTGPRDAVFPLRKPVMRWIPPLPIGMDWKRELPTNIRVVGG